MTNIQALERIGRTITQVDLPVRKFRRKEYAMMQAVVEELEAQKKKIRILLLQKWPVYKSELESILKGSERE